MTGALHAGPVALDPPGFEVPALRITFEREPDEGHLFAHIWIRDGRILGKAGLIRSAIPVGAWVSVAEHQRPGGWYLVRHCGFEFVASMTSVDEEPVAVYRKVR